MDVSPRGRLLVLGDVMLDRYTCGEAERVSPEAPVLVLRSEDEEVRLGGAASVASLLAGLGVCGVVAGVIGDDPAGRTVDCLLRDLGQNSASLLITDPARPTTVKQRLLGRAANHVPHQILRLDRESRQPLDKSQSENLAKSVTEELPNCQAMLISDYAKGVCTQALLSTVIATARELRLPVLVDPACGADYKIYRGASVIKPNRREAELASGRAIRSPGDAFLAGRDLCGRWGFEAAAITLDAEGLALITADGVRRHWVVPQRVVSDATGAGDTVLALLGVGLAEGRSLRSACRLSVLAAGLQVERLGVATISRIEIAAEARRLGNPAVCAAPPQSPRFWHTAPRDRLSENSRKIVTLDALARLVKRHRAEGRRVVFSNGCFDLLHVGHVQCLDKASALGDMLIVAINSDASVRKLKGEGRPVISERDRATMLAALACVDYVVIFNEPTPDRLLNRLRPDVLVKGGGYGADQVVGRRIVESYGGEVRVVEHTADMSTTAIIERAGFQLANKKRNA